MKPIRCLRHLTLIDFNWIISPQLQHGKRNITSSSEPVRVKFSKGRAILLTTITCVGGYLSFKGITTILGEKLAEGTLGYGQQGTLNSVNVFNSTGIIYPSNWVETVAYNPSLLYSTLIIAILLTKGYGRNIAIAVGRRFLQEPSRRLWRLIRKIKPRQIVYYGMKWGIPFHALKDILLLHRNLLKFWPKRFSSRPSRKTCKKQSLKARSLNTTVTLYRKLPWKALSRSFGSLMSWELPMFMREPCIGYYCKKYGVNLNEASDENLKNYRSLSEFFRRQLKPNVRVIDKEAPVVSPADGRVLHFGTVDNGVVEQVKGVNYAIKAFLGPHPLSGSKTDHNVEDQDYHRKMNLKPGNQLYNCIVYLSPGDYHRFHSSADWTISHRRHFPGELLSVKPGYARWIQGLFNFNERVVYSGTWKHGYFSYTAVGATNVGSMKVYIDEDLETNSRKIAKGTSYFDKNFVDGDKGSILVSKGEMFGEFNLGSTIVVMFEAPKDFRFNVEPGQVVKYGQSLGEISSRKY